MKEEEGLYYRCSENKGVDQLSGYCEAGVRLCFCICRLLVFLCSGSYVNVEAFILCNLFYLVRLIIIHIFFQKWKRVPVLKVFKLIYLIIITIKLS